MENVKYASIYRIIEEVFSFEDYAHEVSWNDMITWTGKCLALINAPGLYVSKITGTDLLTPHVECTDYRGDLPIDFVEIEKDGVRDSVSGEIYNYSGNVNENYGGPTYVIKDSHIDISEETATLELKYTAFRIDEHGFPMVPDIERVIEAVRSYLTFRIDHKLWRKGKIADKIYEDSRREQLWYMGSAQNALRLMNAERRMTFTKRWTQLLPTMISNAPSNSDSITEDFSGYTKPAVYAPNLPSSADS